MSIFFYARKRINPQDVESGSTYYPAPAYVSEIGLKQLAAEISDNTALTPTEVSAVLQSFITTIPKYMLLGYKVRLPGLGIFKTSFLKTKGGYTNSKQVSSSDIGSVKPIFTVAKAFNELFEKAEFVKYGGNYTLPADEEDVSQITAEADTGTVTGSDTQS